MVEGLLEEKLAFICVEQAGHSGSVSLVFQMCVHWSAVGFACMHSAYRLNIKNKLLFFTIILT